MYCDESCASLNMSQVESNATILTQNREDNYQPTGNGKLIWINILLTQH